MKQHDSSLSTLLPFGQLTSRHRLLVSVHRPWFFPSCKAKARSLRFGK